MNSANKRIADELLQGTKDSLVQAIRRTVFQYHLDSERSLEDTMQRLQKECKSKEQKEMLDTIASLYQTLMEEDVSLEEVLTALPAFNGILHNIEKVVGAEGTLKKMDLQ